MIIFVIMYNHLFTPLPSVWRIRTRSVNSFMVWREKIRKVRPFARPCLYRLILSAFTAFKRIGLEAFWVLWRKLGRKGRRPLPIMTNYGGSSTLRQAVNPTRGLKMRRIKKNEGGKRGETSEGRVGVIQFIFRLGKGG